MKDVYGTISLTPGNPTFKAFSNGTVGGARSMSMKVSYKTPLTIQEAGEKFNVSISISGIGFTHASEQEVIRTSAEQIDALSFALKLQTWGKTGIEFVDLNWHCYVEKVTEVQIETLPG